MQRKQSQKQQCQQYRQPTGYTHPAMRLHNTGVDQEAAKATAPLLRPTTRSQQAPTGVQDKKKKEKEAEEEEEDNESGEAGAADDDGDGDVALLDCVAHAQANVTIRESSDCVYQQRQHQPQHPHQDNVVNLHMSGDIGFRKTTWFAHSANAAGHGHAAAAAATSGSTSKEAAMKTMKNVCNDERA